MSSLRARPVLLLLALISWLPLLSPARAAAGSAPPTATVPDCTAATSTAEVVASGGIPHATHWVTLDPSQGCNWHVEVVGGAGWISGVAVGSWSWRTVEFAVAANGTTAHRSATVRILAGTAGTTQIGSFQVEQDAPLQGCTGFGAPQLNNPNPPEGGGGFGALVPLVPNMDCPQWAVSVPSWVHVSDIYNTLRGSQWYGHFFYTIDPNTTGQARSSPVVVYRPDHTDLQSPPVSVAQPACAYAVTGQPQQALPGLGGTYAQMQVTTQTGCPSQPAQQPAWIRFQGQSTTFDYDPNGPTARTGVLAFGSQNVAVQQAPLPAETYRITSKAILPPSHISDPLPLGAQCDGGADLTVRDGTPITWLRGDNHSRFDPAPDGAFSGPGLNGTADARTLDQVEFTWNGSQFSGVRFFHNIIESHRDFTYLHGDLFFSCAQAGQANTPQEGTASISADGNGHIKLSSSVAIPPSLVSIAPNLDTTLNVTIDRAHNMMLDWREDPWSQGYRVERRRPDGSWMTLKTHITSDVSCIDLYGSYGDLEAFNRINAFLPFHTVTGSAIFNLPTITQTQPEEVEGCVDVYTQHEWWREPCSVHTLLPSLAEIAPGSQQGRSVLGVAWPSCIWSAESSAPWLTPQAPNGSGSGYVSYTAAANTTPDCRYGSITYNTPYSGTPGKLSVTQLGLGPADRWNAAADFRPEGLSNPSADCHGDLGVWEYMASARGGNRSAVERFPIFHHDSDCSAASRSYWKPSSSGCEASIGRAGLGSRLFLTPSARARSVIAWHNPEHNPELTGLFTISGNIHDEGGHGGHWYIDKGTTVIASGNLTGGDTRPFNQTIPITGGETVLFTYEDDPGAASEASVDLTIAKAVNPNCALDQIQPYDAYLDANAHNGQTLAITSNLAYCPFTAQTSSPGQLTLPNPGGITSPGVEASLVYNVTANPGQTRVMTLLVTMGQTTRTLTVHQNGADPCQVTALNAYSQTVDSGAHTINLVVTTTTPNCSFTAARVAGEPWVGFPSGGTTGPDRQATITLHAEANTSAQRRTDVIRFAPTAGQTTIEFALTQQAYQSGDPCAQGWSSDSYIPINLNFAGPAGGRVEFRINAPAGCRYQAIERCSGTSCWTYNPQLSTSLDSHEGSAPYSTYVHDLDCATNPGTRLTTNVDVKTVNDNRTRYTIGISQGCAEYVANTPGTAAGEGPPIPDLPVDPDQWNNSSCLPSLEDALDAGSDGAATASAVGRQVDSLAESLGQEYRKRRSLILATSSDPKADLAALESEMTTRFEQGTIDLYDQNKLFNPFDPGCQQPPPILAPAQP